MIIMRHTATMPMIDQAWAGLCLCSNTSLKCEQTVAFRCDKRYQKKKRLKLPDAFFFSFLLRGTPLLRREQK